MNMSRPGPGPLSPLSMNSSDSLTSRYGNLGGTPNDVAYSGGPYGAARPPPGPSPPGSNRPSGSTDMSRPSASGSSLNRPPSSASSIARSSDGRLGFGGPPKPRPESGRSQFKPDHEDALQRHYQVLSGYLRSHLHDEKGNMKPNRARDKLLRLSVTQFMELSTDVYDELIRREDERMQRVANVPKSLPPKQNFHPKRNQARQKLSTLPIERFRQLATDVFFELERRIPRFAGGDIDRPMSAASNASRGGMRPPPGPGYRGPPSGTGRRPSAGSIGMGPPNTQYQNFRPASPGINGGPAPGTRPPTAGSDSGAFGRPLPKTFQSNTIVPNKSTMVEDDDSDEEEDAFGLNKVVSGFSEPLSHNLSLGSNSEDREKIKAQEAEIGELKEKLDRMESSLSAKDQEIEAHKGSLLDRERDLERVRASGQEREEGLSAERNEWYDLREELEQKHLDAQRLNDNLQRELDQLQRMKSQDEQANRSQTDRQLEDLKTLNDNLQHELEQLHSSKTQEHADLRSQSTRDMEDLRTQLSLSHGAAMGDLRTELDRMQNQTSELHRQMQTHQNEKDELKRQLEDQQQLERTASNSDYEHKIELLQEELSVQEKLTNEVRDEAMLYLREMRDLSRQNDSAVEQEEKLAARVSQLEQEIEHWRARYARVKAQNKVIRASTLGAGLQPAFDSGSLVRKEGLVSEGGLVRDVDITRFQMAIDELLKVARQSETEPMLDGVKSVALSVQSITSNVGTDGYPTPTPSPLSPESRHEQQPESVAKLKARVTGTANSLITATKQHASASGISPVALLDAAASNLTASVVELIKAVGIRPSTSADLQSDLDDGEEDMGSFYDDRMSPGPSGDESMDAMPVHVSSPSESSEPKPAPLNIARSNTTKGWFGGWGKKPSVDETAAVATKHVNGSTEEYDPYR